MIDNILVSNSRSLYEQIADNVILCHFAVGFEPFFTQSGIKTIICVENLFDLIDSAQQNLQPLQRECIKIITLIDGDIKQLSDLNQSVLENSEKRSIPKLTQNIKKQIECEFFKIEKLEKEIEFLNKQCKLLIEKIDVINLKDDENPSDLKQFAEAIKSAAEKMLENNKKIEEEVVQKFYEKIKAFGTALETVEETTKAEEAPKVEETSKLEEAPKLEETTKPEEAPKKRCQFGRRLLPFMANAVAGVALVCYAYLIAQNVNQQPFGTGDVL